MSNCGTCRYARIVVQDIKIRICRGAPPQVVLIPANGNQARMEAHYPVVSSNDEGCGMYMPRIMNTTVIDIDISGQGELKQ